MTDWPILVLTLPGDDTRRAPLLDQLAGFGLSYQLFMGVDGRSGLPAQYEAMIDRAMARARLGRDMSDGEFACALSHRAIYDHVRKSGLPGAIVLEDDARLEPDFSRFVASRDYQSVPMVLIDFAFGRAFPLLRRKVAGGHLHRAAVQATVTTAYSVSAGAAVRLLDRTSPVSHPADWPCELFELGAWLMVPRLARHDAPGARVSHLDKGRPAAGTSKARRPGGFLRWLRSRISVRVGRAKGQR